MSKSLAILNLAFVWFFVFLYVRQHYRVRKLAWELWATWKGIQDSLDPATIQKVLRRRDEVADETFKDYGLVKPRK